MFSNHESGLVKYLSFEKPNKMKSKLKKDASNALHDWRKYLNVFKVLYSKAKGETKKVSRWLDLKLNKLKSSKIFTCGSTLQI